MTDGATARAANRRAGAVLSQRLGGLLRRRRKHRSPAREAVIWGYRLLLDRDPESEAVVEAAMRFPSPEAFVRALVTSTEFRNRGMIGGRQMEPFAAPLEVAWEVDRGAMDELLAHIAASWERLGEERPHWSVLAGPEHLPENMTPARRSEFYEGGRYDLQLLLATLARVGRDPAEFATVFEFGCGVGRVTSHLCRMFNAVIACDISSRHLALARATLAERGLGNVVLRQAGIADFGMSEPYDLWFNRLVLQHNPPPLIAAIISRGLSLLRSRGLAVFQVPVYLSGYRFAIDEYRAARAGFGPFEMHALPQTAVLAIAAAAGCRLCEVREDDSAGDPWISQVFTFEKT